MSELVYITDLVKINHQDDVVAARENGYGVSPVYGGFSTFSNQYAFGNWICKLSNGDQMVQSEDYVQAMVKSLPAFAKAGLVALDGSADVIGDRLVLEFCSDTVLIYVTPESTRDLRSDEIVVLERSAQRDDLTGTVDGNRTWVIIASEYTSGRKVDGVLLSHFVEMLVERGIEYNLGSRGPEFVA